MHVAGDDCDVKRRRIRTRIAGVIGPVLGASANLPERFGIGPGKLTEKQTPGANFRGQMSR